MSNIDQFHKQNKRKMLIPVFGMDSVDHSSSDLLLWG